jgi:hypothetical protein
MLLVESFRSLLGERPEKLARELSLQALVGYRRVRAQAPDLSGEPLYQRVMSSHFGVDDARARALVEGARESYADWPIARELTLSDVVHYLVAERCRDPQEPDQTHRIHGRIGRVVRNIIPQDI